MEGVMMRSGDRYAVAVRKSDGQIDVRVFPYQGLVRNQGIRNLPVLSGIVSFAESLATGMRALSLSASLCEEEGKEEAQEDASMGFSFFVAVVLAVGIFMVLPYWISLFLQRYIASGVMMALAEGAVRLLIFTGYVTAISCMPDIKRVYRYHGAEHKCINCIEQGMELSVENVRNSSRQHRRCGTGFLLIVMFVSIVFFLFIRVDSRVSALLLRVLLVPVIAGISYEFIRIAGRSDNALVNSLSRPGMWLQNLTTGEPDDAMIEVGIASVEAVFDWRSFVAEDEAGER